MRVAIVSPVFPPYRGGIGAVAAADKANLASLGIEATVFTPLYEAGRESAGAQMLRPLIAHGNAAVTPSLLWRLRKFDLIHLHYTAYGMDIFAVFASWIFRKPLFLTYHMKPVSADWRNIIFKLHRAFLEPFILFSANTVFVSSADYANAMRMKHRNLIELPFSVDTEKFSPGRDMAMRQKLGLTPDAFTMIFVGGLDKAHYFKGLDVLLKSVAELPRSSAFALLVVGDGDERPYFEKHAEALGIANHVRFLGNVSPEELPCVYRASDVHILPSLDRGEAFGLVTLEAAASGIPSIVSDLPGMRTIVDPDVTGVRIPAGDHTSLTKTLEKFMAQPELRKTMGEAARKRILERYDRHKVAEVLLAAYNKMVV